MPANSAGIAFFGLALDDAEFRKGLARTGKAIGGLRAIGGLDAAFQQFASATGLVETQLGRTAQAALGFVSTGALLGSSIKALSAIINNALLGPLGLAAIAVGAVVTALATLQDQSNDLNFKNAIKQAEELTKAQDKLIESLRKTAKERKEAKERDEKRFADDMMRMRDEGRRDELERERDAKIKERERLERVAESAEQARLRALTPTEQFQERRKELQQAEKDLNDIFNKLGVEAGEKAAAALAFALERLEQEERRHSDKLIKEAEDKRRNFQIDPMTEFLMKFPGLEIGGGPAAKLPSLGAIFGGRLAEQMVGPGPKSQQAVDLGKKQLEELKEIKRALKERLEKQQLEELKEIKRALKEGVVVP